MEFLEGFIQQSLGNGELSLVTLLMVFAAGVLTSTTPCVYPMIPITVGVLGSESNLKKRSSRLLGPVIYVAGLAVVYGSLGLFAAATGRMFGEISSNPMAYIVVANLCFVFALWMMGWINLPHFAIGQQWQQKFSHPYLRLFVIGGASGLIAAPCTAPVLGMLLMYIATTGELVYGGVLMVVFAYGLGSLLLILGWSSQWLSRLPKSGNWMNHSKIVLALLMAGSGQYLLTEAGKLLF